MKKNMSIRLKVMIRSASSCWRRLRVRAVSAEPSVRLNWLKALSM